MYKIGDFESSYFKYVSEWYGKCYKLAELMDFQAANVSKIFNVIYFVDVEHFPQ